MSARPVLLAWIAVLCVAVALSVLAAANETLPGDRAVTDWLQDQPVPGQDLSDFIRAITGTEVVLATGAALALVLWIRGYRRHALLLIGGLIMLPVLQYSLKELIDRPRPSGEFVDVRGSRTSPSFPSGHAMSGVFLFAALTYLALTLALPRLAAWPLAAFSVAVIILTGPVNVWLGVHWPSDVLGSWLWCLVLLLPLFLLDRFVIRD
jgi:undecaprenyl-diphosphatase